MVCLGISNGSTPLGSLEQLQQLAKIQSKSHFWMLKGKKGAPVSQNPEQKPFLDAKGEKRCSSSGAIAEAKI